MQHNFKMGEVDFKGDHLCEPCWNGQHYTWTIDAKRHIGTKISKCKGGMCDCQCRALLEPEPRPKRDKSLQMTLADATRETIHIGTSDSHKGIG